MLVFALLLATACSVASSKIAILHPTATCFTVAHKSLCCSNGVVGQGVQYNLTSEQYKNDKDLECCGTSTKAYNPDKAYCCNNEVTMKMSDVAMECCKTCQPQASYDRSKQIECGNKLHTIQSTEPTACCGGKPYITSQEICCDGYLSKRNMATACCGKFPMYGATSNDLKCCNDRTNIVRNYHKAYTPSGPIASSCCKGMGVVLNALLKPGECTQI